MARRDSERLVDVPMAGNARESVRNARINSGVTDGVKGNSECYGVNEGANIKAAERLEQGDGTGNVVTGRHKGTRYTGEK